MIFRRERSGHESDKKTGVRPVWQAFLETQKSIDPPYGIVFQAEHARLAGKLAANLQPEVFGPLPPGVLEAISLHDVGWQQGDEAQLSAIAQKPPRPFPLLSGEESIPYWDESIRCAEQISRLAGVIVSRHFCALAAQDPGRREFAQREARRREAIEMKLDLPKADLDRWTAAIGFSDILSLTCVAERERRSNSRSHIRLFPMHPTLARSFSNGTGKIRDFRRP